MNAREAAERAEVNPSTITRWVQSGRLKAKRRPDGELEIPESSLAKFLDTRAASHAGRPSRSKSAARASKVGASSGAKGAPTAPGSSPTPTCSTETVVLASPTTMRPKISAAAMRCRRGIVWHSGTG